MVSHVIYRCVPNTGMSDCIHASSYSASCQRVWHTAVPLLCVRVHVLLSILSYAQHLCRVHEWLYSSSCVNATCFRSHSLVTGTPTCGTSLSCSSRCVVD